MDNEMLKTLLSGAIGSIIVFLLGSILTAYYRKKDLNLRYRSYISVSELYNCEYDFKNANLGKRKKIIQTDGYKRLVKINEVKNREVFLGFLKIENVGDNMILDLNCIIKTIYDDNLETETTANFLNLTPKDEIYISLIEPEVLQDRKYRERKEFEIIITYRTVSGERFKFIRKIWIDGNSILDEKLCKLVFWGKVNMPLYKTKTIPLGWRYSNDENLEN